jgi:hypothetical protein
MVKKELKKEISHYYANEKNKNSTVAHIAWNTFFTSKGAGFAFFSIL